MLREVRRKPPSGDWISLSGADPLNLVGILTPGPKLAALTGNRLLYRDGLPVALLAGGEVQFLEDLDAATQWEARKALLRGAVPASLIALVLTATISRSHCGYVVLDGAVYVTLGEAEPFRHLERVVTAFDDVEIG